MKQPQLYKAPKCDTGKCSPKKAKKKLPKNLDFSKMTPMSESYKTTQADLDQQVRSKIPKNKKGK